MIRNYLLIVYRNLVRNKTFAVLNIIGLAVGISAALIVGSFAIGELKVDSFQKEAASTYLLYWQQEIKGGGARKVGLTGEEDATLLREKLASVTDVLNVRPFTTTFEYNNRLVKSEVMIAEQSFFDFFSFELLQGNPLSALSDPSSVVLSESTAISIFGDQNPIGQSVRIVGDFEMPLQVTGIVKDYADSHLKISAIFPGMLKPQTVESWQNGTNCRYIPT